MKQTTMQRISCRNRIGLCLTCGAGSGGSPPCCTLAPRQTALQTAARARGSPGGPRHARTWDPRQRWTPRQLLCRVQRSCQRPLWSQARLQAFALAHQSWWRHRPAKQHRQQVWFKCHVPAAVRYLCTLFFSCAPNVCGISEPLTVERPNTTPRQASHAHPPVPSPISSPKRCK